MAGMTVKKFLEALTRSRSSPRKLFPPGPSPTATCRGEKPMTAYSMRSSPDCLCLKGANMLSGRAGAWRVSTTLLYESKRS
jgi:hypothetical protein